MVGFRRNCSVFQWAVALAVVGLLIVPLTAIAAGGDKGQPIADPPKTDAKTVDNVGESQPVLIDEFGRRPREKRDYSKTPEKDLVPATPTVAPKAWSLKVADLEQVPELAFWDPLPKTAKPGGAHDQIAFMTAKINHLNRKKTDHFMHVLINHRLDLAGLPFVMGDACRLKKERSRAFASTVNMIQDSLRELKRDGRLDAFWANFADDHKRFSKPLAEEWIGGSTAALMQMLAPESSAMRQRLVKYLAGINHPETTRALARLAVFSAEPEVRRPAQDALKNRDAKDCTEVLLGGVRYPWPAVANQALESVVKLERTDLTLALVDLLDQPDPREPVVKEIKSKKTSVARELVRVNHHRNCLLCHAPGNEPDVTNSGDITSGAVPLPDQPLQEPSEGYRGSSPDLFVRVDVTYLRQDFSLFQPVENADPWPRMQRFDFLVRTRVLTDAEAKAHAKVVHEREGDYVSPYHLAIDSALRELTGWEAAPNARAWRTLLGL